MTTFLATLDTPRSTSPNSVNHRREWGRHINRSLRDLHEQTWGFTIFRITYTPESDARFALFLEKLTIYVNYSIDDDLRPSPFRARKTEPPFDTGPNEEMKRRFVNDIVEDRNLDGADTDIVRIAFAKWLEDKGVDIQIHQLYARHRVCIMVDDAVLDSVVAAPEDPSIYDELDDELDDELSVPWVKVVEYLAPGESEWQAWLKVGIAALHFFWFNVYGGEEVESTFQMIEDGKDVYNGE